jgi:cytochrome c oxidase subunit 2
MTLRDNHDPAHEPIHERRILGTELLWAFGVGIFIAATISMVVLTALTRDINPPSNVERIDPKTLHLSGEFAEHNLGTTIAPDGSVTTRIIATQFMFAPRCIPVPERRRVTLRFASPDVIHGILITGTNVNTMVIPGFVAQVHTEFTRGGDLLMPCHEYCGLGHSEMWATVQVLPANEVKPDAEGRVSCAQR